MNIITAGHVSKRLPAAVYLCVTGLLLTACTEEAPPPMDRDAAYGEVVDFLHAKSIHYPAFSLRFIEKEAVQIDPQNRGTRYRFHLADGVHHRKLEWIDAGYRTASFDTFEISGKNYFLELKSSTFLGRALGDDELIVWNDERYQAYMEKITRVIQQQQRDTIEPLLKSTQKQERERTGRELLTFYRDYMHILNNGDREYIGFYLAFDADERIGALFSRTNPRWDTLSLKGIRLRETETRLYLEGESEQGTQLVGVSLVKREAQWKIVHDMILPSNTEGRKAMSRFMQ